ncbi:ankyrin repeat-containing domain protein [Parachaetomium inaequale]|uniref:Ankyrin repeat-containing domain protein n=1 Tax=Parachaetomium inaequale TaxID=2588326 RepID=A0AAN6SNQ7_9PEZI|nr:ankyrin repeat-containing domain protein [Parachaetomium inaequale]
MPVSEILIALMGTTGVGKSTFIKCATGDPTIHIGHGVDSATREVAEYQFTYSGHIVTLVDMPGYDDSSMPDAAMLEKTSEWLIHSYTEGRKLSGILWLESVEKRRIGGSGQKALDLFQLVSGSDFMKNVVLVQSLGDDPFTSAQQRRADDLQNKYWNTLIGNGATTRRFDRFDEDHPSELQHAKNQAYQIIRQVLNNTPHATKLQEEVVDEQTNFNETAAGKFVNKEYDDMREHFEKKADEYKKQAEEAEKRGNSAIKMMNEALEKAAKDNAASIRIQKSLIRDFAEERKSWQAANAAAPNANASAASTPAPQASAGSTTDQLLRAVKKQDTAALGNLFNSGVYVNTVFNEGSTCLHMASGYGFLKVVSFLLVQRGADTSIRNGGGNTALHYAAWKGHLSVVKLLIQYMDERDLNIKNSHGNTALYEACLFGYRAVAEELMDADADMNARNAEGKSPLHAAALRGHRAVARALLEADPPARVYAKDSKGRTPSQLARAKGFPSTAELIEDYED